MPTVNASVYLIKPFLNYAKRLLHLKSHLQLKHITYKTLFQLFSGQIQVRDCGFYSHVLYVTHSFAFVITNCIGLQNSSLLV